MISIHVLQYLEFDFNQSGIGNLNGNPSSCQNIEQSIQITKQPKLESKLRVFFSITFKFPVAKKLDFFIQIFHQNNEMQMDQMVKNILQSNVKDYKSPIIILKTIILNIFQKDMEITRFSKDQAKLIYLKQDQKLCFKLNEFFSAQSEYQKTYYYSNFEQLEVMKSRSKIKNFLLPQFEILSQCNNFITVKLKKYQYSGIERIIKNCHDKLLTQKTIEKIFDTIAWIQYSYGQFELTDKKIRSDWQGNIVVWPTEDFQKCFSIKVPHEQNLERNLSSYLKRLQNKVQRFKQMVSRVIFINQLKIDLKSFINQLQEIKIKSLQNFHNKSSFYVISNQEIKLSKEPVGKYFDAKGEKLMKNSLTFEMSDMKHKQKNSFVTWTKLQKQNKDNSKRFSFLSDQQRPNLGRYRSPLMKKARMSDFQWVTDKFLKFNSPKKQKNPGEKKVPQFIKEKLKAKTAETKKFKLKFQLKSQESQKNDNQTRSNTLKLPQINSIHHFRQEVSINIDETEESEFLNELKEKQNLQVPPSITNVKSCPQMGLKCQAETNQNNVSPDKKQNQSDNGNIFFLSNLSKTQEKQLMDDFDKIFMSRRVKQDDFVIENQELKQQLMLLMG